MKRSNKETISRKDLSADSVLRWCPGCGDYTILNAVKAAIAKIGIPEHEIVFLGGAGCAGKLPFYMDTFGLHTISGRTPAFATGIKLANPELSVWAVIGDGDGLSAGLSHFIHALRRNVDVKFLLVNNQTLGLAHGLNSPTSPVGQVTRTCPSGNTEHPLQPVPLALLAGATFVARTVDTDMRHMSSMIELIARHRGAAVLEILSNCVVFNDGAFEHVSEKSVREDRVVDLRIGERLLFGKNLDKGVFVGADGARVVDPADASIWDPVMESALVGQLPMDQGGSDLPTPRGVFRSIDTLTFEDRMHGDFEKRDETVFAEIRGLMEDGETWQI